MNLPLVAECPACGTTLNRADIPPKNTPVRPKDPAAIPYTLADLVQAQQHQLRALYFHNRIQSGVYKKRVVHKGGLDGPLLSKQELLEDEIETMYHHIGLAQQILDGG